MAPHRFVDTEAELAWVVEQLLVQPRYALDTEFHRERTYWPKVALVQIAWPGELVLIDPLAVDLAPLRALMDSDALAVLHAASQDLEELELATGAVPRRLIYTQIAAGFLGLSTPSLASLHERELGVQLPKGNRLTDWLERPLKPAQKDYAAADVERLLEIHDAIVAQIDRLGRVAWLKRNARSRTRAVLATHGGVRKRGPSPQRVGTVDRLLDCLAQRRPPRSTNRFVSSCPTSPSSRLRSRHRIPPRPCEGSVFIKGRRGAIGRRSLPRSPRKGHRLASTAPQKRRDDGRDIRPAAAQRLREPDRPPTARPPLANADVEASSEETRTLSRARLAGRDGRGPITASSRAMLRWPSRAAMSCLSRQPAACPLRAGNLLA